MNGFLNRLNGSSIHEPAPPATQAPDPKYRERGSRTRLTNGHPHRADAKLRRFSFEDDDA